MNAIIISMNTAYKNIISIELEYKFKTKEVEWTYPTTLKEKIVMSYHTGLLNFIITVRTLVLE